MVLERVRNALKVEITPISLPTNIHTGKKPYKLGITSKNYKFKNKITNDTVLQKTTNLHLLYICKGYKDNKASFIIDFTSATTMTDLIIFLRSVFGGNEFSYIQHENNIYAKEQEMIRDGLALRIPASIVFINSEACLSLSPDDDIFFYNGETCTTLKVERIHAIYKDREISIREYFHRDIMCKACNKKVSSVVCINDPILPVKEKDLCNECFEELFVTEKGELRYEGMSYKKTR